VPDQVQLDARHVMHLQGMEVAEDLVDLGQVQQCLLAALNKLLDTPLALGMFCRNLEAAFATLEKELAARDLPPEPATKPEEAPDAPV
jgi:hypothetical protein